ncbi:MAG: hypothetical protein HY741_18860 [Chloroflexi bacterium]|nr:hypothetical protein [Chloroflexota bacterium]
MSRTPSPDLEIYAGHWIALVRGRVVASGATAQETLLNCRAMRLKDEPVLRFIPLKKRSDELIRPRND